MFDNAFTSEALTEALDILKNDFPLAIWETIYVTLLSTLFAIIIGLPLGVLLVAGEKGGVLPPAEGSDEGSQCYYKSSAFGAVFDSDDSRLPTDPSYRRHGSRHSRLDSPARHRVVPVCGAPC